MLRYFFPQQCNVLNELRDPYSVVLSSLVNWTPDDRRCCCCSSSRSSGNKLSSQYAAETLRTIPQAITAENNNSAFISRRTVVIQHTQISLRILLNFACGSVFSLDFETTIYEYEIILHYIMTLEHVRITSKTAKTTNIQNEKGNVNDYKRQHRHSSYWSSTRQFAFATRFRVVVVVSRRRRCRGDRTRYTAHSAAVTSDAVTRNHVISPDGNRPDNHGWSRL